MQNLKKKLLKFANIMPVIHRQEKDSYQWIWIDHYYCANQDLQLQGNMDLGLLYMLLPETNIFIKVFYQAIHKTGLYFPTEHIHEGVWQGLLSLPLNQVV